MTRRAKTLGALNAWQRRQFRYGDADCCQFIAHVIKHLGGEDHRDLFRYENEREAYQIISRFGTLTDFLRHVLGEPTKTLEDGDPVVCRLPTVGEFAGVKLGNQVVCLTQKGFARVKSSSIICGWNQCLQS